MFEDIIKVIKNAESVGIVTHTNPDGDAMGSVYSLKSVLKTMGKKADVYLSGEVESCIRDIVFDGEIPSVPLSEHDLLVAFDSSNIERLAEYADDFKNHNNKIAIDHHKTHIPYADIDVVEDISSTCEFVYRIYKEMGVEINKETATALYVGLSTDTGNFKYSSVTSDTHRTAGELIDLGVDFSDIAKRIYDTVSKEYLKLTEIAIRRMEFYADNKIAVLTLDESDFVNTGITEADASKIVTLPGTIEGVLVGIYYRQRGTDEYKVSVRTSANIDVSKLAELFDGGGHTKASGYSIKLSEYKENKALLIENTKRCLKDVTENI